MLIVESTKNHATISSWVKNHYLHKRLEGGYLADLTDHLDLLLGGSLLQHVLDDVTRKLVPE